MRDFFMYVERFSRGDIPRLFVFVGAPGTGKTSLVHLFEKWADVHFHSGASLVSEWQNSGAGKIKEMYETAYKAGVSGKPQIIFIDEVDAISQGDRGKMNDAFRNALLELCQQVSYSPAEKKYPHSIVITIVASNELNSIDQALISRATLIPFPLPDNDDRQKILRRYVGTYPHELSEDDFEELVSNTVHFSPRDIEEAVRRARFVAKRDQLSLLRKSDLLNAIGFIKEKKEEDEQAKKEKEEKDRQQRYPYHVDKANAVNQWAEAAKNTGKAATCLAGIGAVVYGAAQVSEATKKIRSNLASGDLATLVAIVKGSGLRRGLRRSKN